MTIPMTVDKARALLEHARSTQEEDKYIDACIAVVRDLDEDAFWKKP